MGLTIHYELRLSDTKSPEDVDRVLGAMRAQAIQLRFADVKRLSMMNTSAPESKWLSFWASFIAEPNPDDIPSMMGEPESARGFVVYPGQGAETATFGFLRRRDESGACGEWYWRAFCKTQYASTVSAEHFVRCHRLITHLLDFAVTLGVDVSVLDDGEYWETRDESLLMQHVERANHLVATLGGRLMDTLGADQPVHSPIFAHPRFEHLEMGIEDD